MLSLGICQERAGYRASSKRFSGITWLIDWFITSLLPVSLLFLHLSLVLYLSIPICLFLLSFICSSAVYCILQCIRHCAKFLFSGQNHKSDIPAFRDLGRCLRILCIWLVLIKLTRVINQNVNGLVYSGGLSFPVDSMLSICIWKREV